jgi:hypothetical protein
VAQKEAVDHVQRKQDYLRVVVDVAVGTLGVTTGLEAILVSSSRPRS